MPPKILLGKLIYLKVKWSLSDGLSRKLNSLNLCFVGARWVIAILFLYYVKNTCRIYVYFYYLLHCNNIIGLLDVNFLFLLYFSVELNNLMLHISWYVKHIKFYQNMKILLES